MNAMSSPKLIFAGTSGFSAEVLKHIIESGYEVSLILTQPDKPRGRGLISSFSEVKVIASERGIPIYQPKSLLLVEAKNRLEEMGSELLVVAAYGQIIPKVILDLFKLGCINIHASLLPRWRGASPIQKAILAGDRETGICVMRMEETLDTGPVYMRKKVEILSSDTAGTLSERLAKVGGKAILQVLESIKNGTVECEPQTITGVLYAKKFAKKDARIDWSLSSEYICRFIRAFSPNPGAFTFLDHAFLKIWRAENYATSISASVGTIFVSNNKSLLVKCGQNAIKIMELQLEGKRRVDVGQFLRGIKNLEGKVLGKKMEVK